MLSLFYIFGKWEGKHETASHAGKAVTESNQNNYQLSALTVRLPCLQSLKVLYSLLLNPFRHSACSRNTLIFVRSPNKLRSMHFSVRNGQLQTCYIHRYNIMTLNWWEAKYTTDTQECNSFSTFCAICVGGKHISEILILRDWCEEVQWWMASPKEMIRPLFKITPQKFSILAQLCNRIFGGFSPQQRLKASTTAELFEIFVFRGRNPTSCESAFSGFRYNSFGTGSPVHQPRHRRVTPTGLYHSPRGIPSQ